MVQTEPGGIRLFLLGMAVLIPAVWLDTSLTGSDEYRVTFRTALETAASDDWTIPTLDGEPRLRKPPLYYWLLASSLEWFGSNPLSLRIWGVICAVLMALVTATIGKRFTGTSAMLIFVILIGTVGLATESRRAMLDIPMAMLLLLSIERFLAWWTDGGSVRIVVAGVLLALACLIKPTALLFGFTAVVSLFLVGPKRSSRATLWQLPLFLAALLVVAIPWWIHAYLQYPELLQQRWSEQIAHRQFSWIHVEAIPSLLGGFLGLILPWSITAVMAVLVFIRRKPDGLENPQRWLVMWVILSSIPFLFMKTFERYLIPILPAMAILTATYLDGLDEDGRIRHLGWATLLLGIPCLLIAAFVGWFGCSLAAAVMIVSAWFLMWLLAREGRILSCALCAAAQLSIVMGIALPSVGIGAMPTIPSVCDDSTFATVGMDLLPTLTLARGRAIEILPTDAISMASALPGEKTTLIVTDDQLPEILVALKLSARKSRPVATFGTFRSRKIFTRFPRADATADDWRQAFMERSLDSLRIPCTILLVEPGEDP